MPFGAGRPSDPFRGFGVRRLLLLGFGGIFGLWLLSAYALASDMLDADSRSLAIRSRFLRNEQLLSTVRAQALLSAVYLRDTLIDQSGAAASRTADKLHELQESIDLVLADYVPHQGSAAERDEWVRLQAELREYWSSFAFRPPLTPMDGMAMSAAYLRDEVVPRREAVIRTSDQIHVLNRDAFAAELAELSEVRTTLRHRVWQISLIFVGIGLGVVVLATRAAGRLEARLHEQHTNEVQHKRELEHLSARLLQAQENEQRRIARELHDQIGQSLSALKLELAVAERSAGAGGEESLSEARSIVEKTLQSVRDLSQLLHPSMLDDLGLLDTATWSLRAFSRRTGIRAELIVEQLDSRLAPGLEACIYRVMQEALTNIARHAQATTCEVLIRRREFSVLLVVTDNGRGFDLARSHSPESRGLGIIGLRERVAALGGTMHLDTAVGRGTTLSVELPIAPDEA